MIGAGRVGSVGGSRGRVTVVTGAPDFTLSANTVTTTWGTVVVGTLSAVNFDPNDVEFFIEETTAASGDEAGFAVVNG